MKDSHSAGAAPQNWGVQFLFSGWQWRRVGRVYSQGRLHSLRCHCETGLLCHRHGSAAPCEYMLDRGCWAFHPAPPCVAWSFWMMNEWRKITTAGKKSVYNVHTMPQKDRHWHRWIGHREKKLFLCLFSDLSVCAFAACLMCRWHSVTQSAVKLACSVSVLSSVWYHRQWAVSNFSPIGLLSSNGMRMCVLVLVCVLVCVWTEWTSCTTLAYPHISSFRAVPVLYTSTRTHAS